MNPYIKLVVNENPDDVCNQQMYQAFVQSLLYLSTKTRSDIAYAVSSVARFCSNPTREHWIVVILQYLKGTSKLGLLYGENISAEIVGYTDANWADSIGDRKSKSVYVFHLGILQ